MKQETFRDVLCSHCFQSVGDEQVGVCAPNHQGIVSDYIRARKAERI